MLVLAYPVREGDTAVGVEIARTTTVLHVVDLEPRAYFFGCSGDGDDPGLEEPGGAGGDCCGEALGCDAEDGGCRGYGGC